MLGFPVRPCACRGRVGCHSAGVVALAPEGYRTRADPRCRQRDRQHERDHGDGCNRRDRRLRHQTRGCRTTRPVRLVDAAQLGRASRTRNVLHVGGTGSTSISHLIWSRRNCFAEAFGWITDHGNRPVGGSAPSTCLCRQAPRREVCDISRNIRLQY